MAQHQTKHERLAKNHDRRKPTTLRHAVRKTGDFQTSSRTDLRWSVIMTCALLSAWYQLLNRYISVKIAVIPERHNKNMNGNSSCENWRRALRGQRRNDSRWQR